MAECPPPRKGLWEVVQQVEQELHAWANPQKTDFENWSRRLNQAIRAKEADSLHPRGRLVATMHQLVLARDRKTKQERLNSLAAALFYAHRMLYEQNLILGMELNDSQQQLITLRQRILDLQIECSNPETAKEKENFPKLKDVLIDGVGILTPNPTSGPKKFYVSARYKGNRPQENYVYPTSVQTGSGNGSDEDENTQQSDVREENEGAQEPSPDHQINSASQCQSKEGKEEPRKRGDSSIKRYEDVREMESYSSAKSYVFSQPRESSSDKDTRAGMEQRFLEIEKQMQTMQEAVSKLVPKGGALRRPISL